MTNEELIAHLDGLRPDLLASDDPKQNLAYVVISVLVGTLIDPGVEKLVRLATMNRAATEQFLREYAAPSN